METKRYYFVLAVVVGILCVPGWGELEVPRFDEPVLLGRPNPALADIDKLLVFIVPSGAEPNKDGLVFKKLEVKVKKRLQGVGIKTDFRIAGSIFNIPELRVDVDMLKLADRQRCVFHIQTSLARAMVLPIQRSLHLKSDVWKAEPVMQAVSVQSMPDKVSKVVLDQVETFISCYQMANPRDVRPADANVVSAVTKEQAKPVTKPVVAKYNYVASKKSKVFHRSECRWTERIKPENLAGYNSKDEAIKAGKIPCKRCKP